MMKDSIKKIGWFVLCGSLLALTFQSCKIGKSYKRPEMPLPDSIWTKQTDLSIADQQWWEVYTDAPLRDLIRTALVDNKDLMVASAKVREMAARKRISTAEMLPQVSGDIHGQRESIDASAHPVKTYVSKAILSWEVDLWGKLRWGKEAAVAEYLGTIEAQRAIRMSVVADVAQAYYELVALDNELTIVRHTLRAREEGVRIARLRFQGGLTNETAYQQAKLEVARTATLVPDLERQIAQKENDIAFLTGEFPQRIERSKLLEEYNYSTMLPVGLPSGLLERRPDVREAEQTLKAANATVGVAYTSMFPGLTLTGNYGLLSYDFSEFLKSPYSLINGALTGPVFEAGKNRANWKAEQAVYEQSLHTYEKTVLNAFREASNAIVDFNKVREMCELQANLEKSARAHEELTHIQYINGVINYLDVLDAQRGYFDAQIALSNAIRDELITVVQIYKALGGGW